MTRIAPPSLRDAETEAEVWLGDLGYAGPVPELFETVKGSRAGGCVPTTPGEAARSRDWVVTRMPTDSRETWTLIPADQEALAGLTAPVLLLRARLLDGSNASHVIEVDQGPSQDDRAGLRRYEVLVSWPRSGEWVVVVTAAGLWGCFVVQVEGGVAPPAVDVEAAEARGRQLADPGEPATLPHAFVRALLQGTSARECVRNENGHARSGEFVWDALGYASKWQPDRATIKNAWIPLHHPATAGQPSLVPLVLRATLLDKPSQTYTYWNPAWVEGDDAVFYVSASFVLPQAGTWVVEASAGTNWGCFLTAVHHDD